MFNQEMWDQIGQDILVTYGLEEDDKLDLHDMFREDFFEYHYSSRLNGIIIDKFVGRNYYDVVDIVIPRFIGPTPVKVIGDYCFSNANFIERIVIPNGIQEIGECAFMSCLNLYKIFLPDQMERIGKSAFSETGIEAIVLPRGIRIIGTNLFYGCRKLKEVFIPDTVVDISSAFEYCEVLEKLFLPDSVRHIERLPQQVNYYDFIAPEGTGLRQTLSKYRKAKYISAEEYCEGKLNEAAINDNAGFPDYKWDLIREHIRKKYRLYDDDFNDVFDKSLFSYHYSERYKGIVLDKFINNYTDVQDIIIPEHIDGKPLKVIGQYCFSNSKYVERISIPNGLQEIQSCAFMNCPNLYKVVLPDFIESIGNSAFSSTAIEAIVVPNGPKTTNTNWFYGCRNVKAIVLPTTMTRIGSFFEYCESLEELFMPGTIKNIDGLPRSVHYFTWITPQSLELASSLKRYGYTLAECMSAEEYYDEYLSDDLKQQEDMASIGMQLEENDFRYEERGEITLKDLWTEDDFNNDAFVNSEYNHVLVETNLFKIQISDITLKHPSIFEDSDPHILIEFDIENYLDSSISVEVDHPTINGASCLASHICEWEEIAEVEENDYCGSGVLSAFGADYSAHDNLDVLTFSIDVSNTEGTITFFQSEAIVIIFNAYHEKLFIKSRPNYKDIVPEEYIYY